MDDVIDINRARRKQSAVGETIRPPRRSDKIAFAEVAEDLESKKIVDAFRRASARRIKPFASKAQKIDVPSIALSRLSILHSDSSKYGTLHVPDEGLPGSPVLIATNEAFFAAVRQGLETTAQARSVISGYILGLAYWYDLFRRSTPSWAGAIRQGRSATLTRAAAKPTWQPCHPNFWQSQDYDRAGYTTQHPILHRAAASLALSATGAELDFDLSEAGPYPIHIAALMDPMPRPVLQVTQSTLLDR